MTDLSGSSYRTLLHTRGFAAIRFGLPLCIGFAALFYIFPSIDIEFSKLFYQSASNESATSGSGFVQLKSLAVLFRLVDIASRVALIGAAIVLIVALIRRHRHRVVAAFICMGLIAGPTLAINAGLKDHWHRARPRDLIEFGGTKRFTPAWVISDQCIQNCSFASGHAAAGFAPVIGHFVSRRRLWLTGGLLLGFGVGLARVAVGAHFLSDVIFAFLVVYLVYGLLALAMGKQEKFTQPHAQKN